MTSFADRQRRTRENEETDQTLRVSSRPLRPLTHSLLTGIDGDRRSPLGRYSEKPESGPFPDPLRSRMPYSGIPAGLNSSPVRTPSPVRSIILKLRSAPALAFQMAPYSSRVILPSLFWSSEARNSLESNPAAAWVGSAAFVAVSVWVWDYFDTAEVCEAAGAGDGARGSVLEQPHRTTTTAARASAARRSLPLSIMLHAPQRPSRNGIPPSTIP